MFRKLRVQFIAVVMVSVALVLGVVFTGICVAEYNKSLNEVHQALADSLDRAVSERGGRMQGTGGFDGPRRPDMYSSASSSSSELGELEGFAGPRIGGDPGNRGLIVPVAVYSVTNVESYTLISEFTTAQIDSDVLTQASALMEDVGDGQGTLGDVGLHYEKRTTEYGIYVAFADTSSTNSWQSLAVSLLVAGIGILAVFFVIALFLSNWALRPVKEAWDSQRQFVADASHELKTPLTVILANNSILMKHSQDTIASQSQWIESTQVEAVNMQGLVNEMLELAQVESRAAMNRERLDFSDLVDGIALQFESVAFERGCELREDVAEDIYVEGDEAHLRKAVSTLTENALKYVEHYGTVSITLQRAAKVCMLKINNTGSVISPEDLPHIFDRFYRTDKARTSGEGGFGLGLAIAREIAREHGGDIECTSGETEGTTFTLTLPLA